MCQMYVCEPPSDRLLMGPRPLPKTPKGQESPGGGLGERTAEMQAPWET